MSHLSHRRSVAAHGSALRRLRSAACLAIAIGLLLPAAAQASEPLIKAAWVTEVGATSARLRAEINPEGSATTYHFSYIAEAAYQENLGKGKEGFAGAAKAPPGAELSIGSGSSVQLVSQQLSTLSPQTAYRYRVVATNSESPVGGTPGSTQTFTTEQSAAVFSLPDNRGWELVSPLGKNGGAIQGAGANHGGDILQAAAQGGEATYTSSSSFAGGQGAPAASQYISDRGAAGWSTQNITTPLLSGSYGDAPDGVPYQLFSADLSRGLLLNGERCRGQGTECPVANPPLPGSGAPPGYQDYYLRSDEDGSFTALLTAADAPSLTLTPEQLELGFAGATPDLSHIVLSTCAKLTAEASEVPSGGGGCKAADPNLYEWSGGQLHLINLLPKETHGTPGASLAAQGLAISADGSRVYFTTEEGKQLYLRRNAEAPQSALGGGGECTEAAKACTVLVSEGGKFQTASTDGSIAFLIKGESLERYDALTEASEPLAGEVKGVLGASADGSYLYYQSAGGLFLSHGGIATKVASEAATTNYPPTTGTARVTPDGTHLAFLSKASLTGYDNAGQQNGEPDTEVYLYSAATHQIACASCNPTGERPLGSSTIPGATPNGKGPNATDAYKPRVLSENGSRVFFNSEDSLALQDTNNRQDVYEWEAPGAGTCAAGTQVNSGCLGLVSSGRDSEPSSFVDASANGSDVFFLTDASLVPSDPGSVDIYDAREGGGFPLPPAEPECEGDSCQNLPSAPEDPTPGTLVPGEGNPPVHFPKAHPPKPHHKKGHKHRKSHKRAARHRGGRG